MSTAAKTVLIAVPWVAVVVLAIVAHWYHEESEAMSAELAVVKQEVGRRVAVAAAESSAERITADEFRQSQDEGREARIEELEELLADLQERYDEAIVADAVSDDEESDKSPLASVLGGVTEEMARSMASTQVSLFYKDFLNELNVDDATRDAVREMLYDFKGAEAWE